MVHCQGQAQQQALLPAAHQVAGLSPSLIRGTPFTACRQLQEIIKATMLRFLGKLQTYPQTSRVLASLSLQNKWDRRNHGSGGGLMPHDTTMAQAMVSCWKHRCSKCQCQTYAEVLDKLSRVLPQLAIVDCLTTPLEQQQLIESLQINAVAWDKQSCRQPEGSSISSCLLGRDCRCQMIFDVLQ